MVPVDTETGTAGTPVPLSGQPFDVAITPDGKTAYVAAAPSAVIPVDTATGAAGTPISVANAPRRIAISPDGATAWVALTESRQLQPVDLATGTAGEPVVLASRPRDLAIAPDGAAAYVAVLASQVEESITGVEKVDLETGTVAERIESIATMDDIAITPNGATVYAIMSGTNQLLVIDTETDTAGPPIGGGFQPQSIAINPVLEQAYTTNFSQNRITIIDTALNQQGSHVGVGKEPYGIAVTPDGALALTANRSSRNVSVIDLDAGVATDPIAPTAGAPYTLAAVPNQPPKASFKAGPTIVDQPITFDASATADPEGGAIEYEWDFGDGEDIVTSEPVVQHTYDATGDQSVRLTVTDEAGCSREFVYTGQTASCAGSAVAVATRDLVVTKAPRLGRLVVKPRRRAIKRGRRAAFRLRVKNAGPAPVARARFCLRAPRRLIKAPRCKRIGQLAPGAAAAKRFRVKVKPRVRSGRTIALVFEAQGQRANARKARARIKVR